MEIIEEKKDNIGIFKLQGRLDSNTSPDFEKRIGESIEKGSQHLVVDLKGLEYISSAGLRVVLKATKDLKRSEGKFVLCTLQDYVREVFEISGFDTFLPIEATVEDALKCI